MEKNEVFFLNIQEIMITFVSPMEKEHQETMKVRLISVGFSVLVLAIFKPFGLTAWQWEAYFHVLVIGLLGFGVCVLTEAVLRYAVRMPRAYDRGVDYIIRRNLWFQIINTLLITVMICLYRHQVLSDRIDDNQLSWGNFFETLVIMAFCSFAIGIYWRYKFRSRYLTAELEELRLLNEQLTNAQQSAAIEQPASTVTLTGTTSETVTLSVSSLLYIEAVGNYVKVYHLKDNEVRSDMLRSTLKQMEEALKDYASIVRCHRAFLVNIAQVEQVLSHAGSMQLQMKYAHDAIPVSRSNITQIKDAILHP